jgi:hypothetical protein
MTCVSPELINAIRIEVGDTDPALPLLHDDEITYALQKYNLSIDKAWPQCAMWILFKLSQAGDSTSGILSYRGSKVSEAYRLALQMKLTNPNLNPILDGLGSYVDDNGKTQNPVYAGGISNSDMKQNDANPDNNYIPNPIYAKSELKPFIGPFSI